LPDVAKGVDGEKSALREIFLRFQFLTLMHHPIVNPNIPRTKGSYSQVVRLDQCLFVSGQASTDPATGDVITGSFEVQARQAFENLSAALRAAGSSLQHVVKTTVFLTDPANFPAFNRLYAEYFPHDPPARSTPIVKLPLEQLAISIEAIAALPE
jgi:2-iminobutanoate/2-iminopropanoate deaminase